MRALLRAPRPRGEVRLVVVDHPAGRRVELEDERAGVTRSIAIYPDEIDGLVAALQSTRAELGRRCKCISAERRTHHAAGSS